MAIIDNRTSRGWLLPHPDNKIKDDVVRLIAALNAADGDVTAILTELGQKAALEHTHEMTAITGLGDALDAKRNLTDPYALDDLSDVNATGAADGQVLIRQTGMWIPINLQVGNITNLETILNGKAPLADPTFTGVPTVPTAAPGTNTAQAASTSFVQAGLTALKSAIEGGVSAAFDTLSEIATALGDRVSFLTIQGKGNQEKGRARTNIDAGVMAGFRNKLINGNFDIWQRTGAGSFIIPAGQSRFVADRWLLENTTNQSVTIERYTASAGDLDAVSPSMTYALKATFTVAPSSGKLFLSQKIEDVRTLAGETAVTASIYATTNIAGMTDVELAVAQSFGTGGSAAVTVRTGSAGSISGAWGKVQALFGVPALTGKTIGAHNYLWATWSVTPRATGQVFFAHASLVEGDSTFEDDPFAARHIQQELELCQRYFEKSYDLDVAPASAGISAGATWAYGATESAGGIGTPIRFAVRKRVVPTMAFYNQATGAAGTWQASANAGNIDAPVGTGGIVGQSGSLAYCNTSFGIWVPAYIRGQWTADAEI